MSQKSKILNPLTGYSNKRIKRFAFFVFTPLSKTFISNITIEGNIQHYQFDLGQSDRPDMQEYRIFYYKNDVKMRMDDDSIGNISTVGFYNDNAYFAGRLKTN